MGASTFESVSASSIKVTKINLSREEEAQYKGMYLFDKSGRNPTKKERAEAKAAGLKASREVFIDVPYLVEQSAWLSERLNTLFGLVGYLVTIGASLQDLEESDGTAAMVNHINMIARNMTSGLTEQAIASRKDDKDFSKELLNIYNALGGGKFLIKDSTVHEGGKDVYFNGTVNNSGASWGADKGYNSPQLIKNSTYDGARLGDYTTPLSLSLLEVLKKFRDDVIGGGNLETLHKREIKQFRLNYNFEKWIPRFEKAGLTLESEVMSRLFKNIHLTDRQVANLKGVMSGVMTVNPVSQVANRKDSPWMKFVNGQGEYEDPNALPPKNEDHFSTEAAICQQDFSLSLVLHLPQNVVNYITQTDDPSKQLFKLSVWSRSWAKNYIRPKHGKSKERIGAVPPFILSPSVLPQLADLRKEAGLPTIDKIGDENSIAVNPNGDLLFLPAREDFDASRSQEYEQLQEDALRMCFENDIPQQDSTSDTKQLNNYYRVANEDRNRKFDDELYGVRDKLRGYEGQLLGYDLDFGILVYAGQSSQTLNTMRLNGSTKPEALAIADLLGYDFSDEGESASFKTFRQSMVRMMHSTVTKDMDTGAIQTGNYLNACLIPLIHTYIHMLGRFPDKFPDLQGMVTQAFQELNITDLREDELNSFQSYFRLFNEKGNLTIEVNPKGYVTFLTDVLGMAMTNAKAQSWQSQLFQIKLKQLDGNAQAVQAELKDDPRYFNESESTMAQFGNLYHHVGGKIFEIMCRALANAKPKDLLTPVSLPELEAANIKFPDYKFVSMTVMPLAVTFAKYVPNAIEIFEQAEETTEGLKKDEDFTPEDMKLPGLKEGTQMFPHQVDSMAHLQTRPKFAILDISPGGGKTILGVVDIINLIGQGEEIKPLVICPDHLVTNWCDDLYKVTDGNWNVIPLSSKSTKGWEDDEVDEVLANAPVNTIAVAGINWIKNHHRKTTIAISNQSVSLPERVDMLRKHNFNYVILDESHKAKKYDPSVKVSQVHDALKMVTTFYKVEYIRLATGTLVPDKVQDVVGQVNLFTASIFGTPEYLEQDVDLGRKEDAPFLVRSKLANYVSLITKKRKDWAFMLPNPIDSFIACSFGDLPTEDEIESGSVESQRLGDMLHYSVYQAVLNDTLDEMQKEAKKKKTEDDEDDDDSDTDNEEGGYSTGDDGVLDTDEEGNVVEGAMTASAMGVHLQRLEQLLTDPWGDTDFQQQAKEQGLKRSGYTPIKIRTVIERLDNHFKLVPYNAENVGKPHQGVIKWERGMLHRELDLVEFEGTTYMARNLDTTEGSVGRGQYPTPSDVPPPEDPTRWKKERTGKVLIFCRYTRTVEAIFKALPTRYKNVARRFHGKLGKYAQEDKWRNLEEFRSQDTDDVKILVANEQAITEGQNLQIASRIIRVEAPWSPGDYEQATARIFRPDVAAAQLDEDGKAGDMSREVIFIDWIMCNGTLEVPKVARLIAKTVETTKFSEKGNDRYDPLAEIGLRKIPMGLEMLRKVETVQDLHEYFEAKAILNDIEQREFWEMRKTTAAAMIPVPSAATHPDFEKLEVAPVSTNVNLKDNQFKFKRFVDWTQEHGDEVKEQYADAYKGLPVRTPFGMGMIVGVTQMNYDPDTLKDGSRVRNGVKYTMQERLVDLGNPLANFKVRLADNSKANGKFKAGELFTVDPKMCHIAEELSDSEFDTFFKSSKTWSTETERKAEARQEEKDRAEREAKEAEERKREAKVRKRIESEKRRQDRIRDRIRNEANNKPINDGVGRKAQPMPEDGVNGKKIDMTVKVHVGVYNGFFGLVGQLRDPDLASFDKEFEFQDFGRFIYLDLRNYADYEALADWLDARETKKGGGWILDKATTLKNLSTIIEVFDQNNRDKFSQKLAVRPQQELPMFLRKKLTKPRGNNAEKKVRMYPIIMHDRVRVCIDAVTSPKVAQAFLRYAPIKGHRGFGDAGKWQIHEGMTVYFCQNKTEAKRKLKQIVNAGYKVSNIKTAVNNIDKLKPVRAKAHKLD